MLQCSPLKRNELSLLGSDGTEEPECIATQVFDKIESPCYNFNLDFPGAPRVLLDKGVSSRKLCWTCQTLEVSSRRDLYGQVLQIGAVSDHSDVIRIAIRKINNN